VDDHKKREEDSDSSSLGRVALDVEYGGMMTQAYDKLKGLLRELFQFDSADLDFGIYRIMNQKRAEIEHFIEHGLAEIADEALSSGAAARLSALASELEEKAEQIRQILAPDAIALDGELRPEWHSSQLGKEYLDLRSRVQGAVNKEDMEATIFNHIYTFFGRYYDNGDFLSKRRYSKRQKYAVPYNGEEVYLYWANADQYYVKTAEHFADYSYEAPNGVTVRFKLAAADSEQDNVKGDKRFFIPRTADATYDEGASALTIPFEYRPLTKRLRG
jgi:adenine-specific DNA-methyltransferase